MNGTWTGQAWIDDSGPVDCRIIIEQEMLVQRSALPRPDPNWTYTDAAGHYHARDNADDHDDYPTLDARSEHRDCDGSCVGTCGGDGFDVTVYTCKICHGQINPGLLYGEHSFTVPGRKSWRAEVATYVPMRQLVSVRLETNFGRTLFGIASAAHVTGDGYRTTSELVGWGKLGERKASARDLDGAAAQ